MNLVLREALIDKLVAAANGTVQLANLTRISHLSSARIEHSFRAESRYHRDYGFVRRRIVHATKINVEFLSAGGRYVKSRFSNVAGIDVGLSHRAKNTGACRARYIEIKTRSGCSAYLPDVQLTKRFAILARRSRGACEFAVSFSNARNGAPQITDLRFTLSNYSTCAHSSRFPLQFAGRARADLAADSSRTK